MVKSSARKICYEKKKELFDAAEKVRWQSAHRLFPFTTGRAEETLLYTHIFRRVEAKSTRKNASLFHRHI